MNDIVIERGMLRVGDRLVPLIAGEIQFWRMDPDTWGSAVRAARDAGVTVISTYLSWRRHEPVPGETDLDGATDPRLDVSGFLRVCSDAGVMVQLKPGPWICAEEPGGGYPDWLLENEQLLARDDRGQVVVGYNPPFLHPVPSYTNPVYLDAVLRWFTSVWEVAGDFAFPNGPIVAIQLDNEPSSCFQDSMYGADYSESAIVAFRRWLNERYGGDLEQVNTAWSDARITNFSTVSPPRRPADEHPSAPRQRLYDWIEFKTESTAAYLAELRRMHTLLGAGHLLYTVNLVTHPVHDVPVSHASIRRIVAATTGEDHYYIPPLDDADIHRLARSAATARAAGEPLPWVPELQAGIWRSPGEKVDYPEPTPCEQEIWWGAAVAYGFAGFNLYMLADRENWEFSPLSADGGRSPFFAPVERLVSVANCEPGALTASPHPTAVVAWHRPDAFDAYAVAGTSRIPEVDWFEDEAYRAYRSWDETLQQLAELGVVYDLWDTVKPLAAPPDVPLLVPGHSTLDRRALDAVRASGRTVIELSPGVTVDQLADDLPCAPRVTSAEGARLDRTLVGIRNLDDRMVMHLVHWGAGAAEATLHLPGIPDGQLTDLVTSITIELRDQSARLSVAAGHHTFVLTRTSAPTIPSHQIEKGRYTTSTRDGA